MKLIDEKLPKELDFTVPARFMNEYKFPNRTNFHPTSSSLEAECRKYKMNWLAMWCVGYVLSNTYYSTEALTKRNHFKLTNADGKLQIFRTWQEGMRAGVQTFALMMGLKLVDPVVWPGSEELGKRYGKFKELKDFDAHFGEGFADAVEKVYSEFLDYLKKDKEQVNLPEPVVVGPDIKPPPLPPAPKPKPEPVVLPPAEGKPAEKPKGKLPWQAKLAAWMAVLTVPLWIAKQFAPGAVGTVIDMIQKLAEMIVNFQF